MATVDVKRTDVVVEGTLVGVAVGALETRGDGAAVGARLGAIERAGIRSVSLPALGQRI